jgi:ABC-2 type transport system permease protein
MPFVSSARSEDEIMKTLINLIRLFLFNCKIRISRSIEFRFDFCLGLFVSLTLSAIGPLVQYLIFTQTNGYPGWSIDQIVLFQGMLLLWLGIKDTIFGDLRNMVQNLVRKGEFDRLLLKPYPPIGVILASGFYYYGTGTIIAGIVVIAYAINKMQLMINPGQLGWFFLFLIAGLILYMGFMVLFCTLVVIFVFTFRAGEILDKILRFSEFPLEIFPRLTRVVFITVFPFAVWIYFPAQALLGRLETKALLGVVFSILFFWINLNLWNWGLKKYTSAGG